MKQEENEIRVFRQFANLCPYEIDQDSINKNNPPVPDITCQTIHGVCIDFEMSECIDESVSRPIHESRMLEKRFPSEFKKLPDDIKIKLTTFLRNASICVKYAAGLRKYQKLSMIPVIFDFLLTLDEKVEGEFLSKDCDKFKGKVDIISIRRGKYNNGPLYHIASGSSYSDPILDRIKSKFSKTYESKTTTDLLIYYALQQEDITLFGVEPIVAFLEVNIHKSGYSRVWIYSFRNDKIIFWYPPL